jgi:16S rRNA (guanine1207-N2)-methyltransferase
VIIFNCPNSRNTLDCSPLSTQTPDNQLIAPQGDFTLNRLPYRAKELLRAWDSADEYLLEQFAAENVPTTAKLLIINDSFGALAIALHHYNPYALSDSYLSQQATRLNLELNQLASSAVTLLNSLDKPPASLDWVLIKVPKTLALLEDELIRLRPQLHANSQILVAGMQKALPASVWILLERLLGTTITAPAKKKAKLIRVRPYAQLPAIPSPYPVRYTLENTDYLISNHANVFSRDSLDIGTRFFLQYLPRLPEVMDIIDLGCGNGVVGLCAAAQNPQATLHFVDESYMAIASARENFYHAFAEHRTAQFYFSNGLTEFNANSADLVLCNPPFHQQHTVGDYIALSLFNGAKRVLRKGGQLWVIGNRHLGYHIALNRLFGGHKVIASNAKFVIWQAVVK